jgi:hypothetical protein
VNGNFATLAASVECRYHENTEEHLQETERLRREIEYLKAELDAQKKSK